MGIFDFLSGFFGPQVADYYFSCPKCKSECRSNAERCDNCGFHIKSIMTRKCPKCGTLNPLTAGRCVKCFYSLAKDKNIKFVYSCPTCGNESENYNQICPACGNQVA